ncbi:MAG: HU family DNA-binding protein, partial [Phycisphaerae bacterium]|nr:HU family DNA-binding protein [Phycisphaerae bacterium]
MRALVGPGQEVRLRPMAGSGLTMNTITKKELIDRLCEQVRAPRSVVRAAVQGFLDEIVKELARGNRLEFRDFGVFETKQRAARR